MKENRLGTREVIVVALALFSAHFGVGDVIFPEKLGHESGVVWLISGLGYFLVNTIIAFLAYLAIAKDRQSIVHMGSAIVSPAFGKVFGTILMLIIGPVFILPRVSSATHEMSVLPLFPNIPLALTLAIFFLLNAYVCLNRSAVVDRLGKFLSPALVVFILLVVLKGIFVPVSSPVATGVTTTEAFGHGFNYGYNTMNAIGAVLMGAWILGEFSRKGIKEPSDQRQNLVSVGLVTVALLGLTQLALTYLGASTGDVYKGASLGELPVLITTHLYGRIGVAIFAVLLALACFTTSAGLTASAGYFFEQLTGGKLKYGTTVVLSSVIGFVLGNVGLSRIVGYTVPWLNLTYPALIVMIVGTVFADVSKARFTLAGGVIAALIFGFFDAVGVAGFQVGWMQSILKAMPLGAAGFAWLVPTIVGLVVGYVFQMAFVRRQKDVALKS